MKKIGVFYLRSEHFVDEANKTVGQPGVGPDAMKVFENRRKVTCRVTPQGRVLKEKAIEYFKKKYKIDVILCWSRFAGCSMCPCSPGFVIKTANENIRYFGRPQREELFIMGTDEGKLEFYQVPNDYNMPIHV